MFFRHGKGVRAKACKFREQEKEIIWSRVRVMLSITKSQLYDVCKIGQKEKTCRYILMNKDGIFCGKTDEKIKGLLDDRASQNKMIAKGNNCKGINI
jgi:hypothetical protein